MGPTLSRQAGAWTLRQFKRDFSPGDGRRTLRERGVSHSPSVAGLAPLIGFLADRWGIGAALMTVALAAVVIFPVLRVRGVRSKPEEVTRRDGSGR